MTNNSSEPPWRGPVALGAMAGVGADVSSTGDAGGPATPDAGESLEGEGGETKGGRSGSLERASAGGEAPTAGPRRSEGGRKSRNVLPIPSVLSTWSSPPR